ncbi:actin-binding Rho-activating protein-like [Contarinia nasturtii]|uniref:actin-binding Rho-activating protein-like n=1 Tax=Contarinia nasturtii TaxID=265458 RepID=UPI0012D3BA5A|nr:actin-binding Rho-activating protein-like [Contarinia nasturtii]
MYKNQIVGGHSSTLPNIRKDNYGRPIAGSLTEARAQKANIHIYREMLQLCEIIDKRGYYQSEETPDLKVIPFGELFRIYTTISNKLVGVLLRARKHELVYFEGEILFQRRDDDVPIFMLKTIDEIKHTLNGIIEEIQSHACSNPLPTDVLLN